MMDDDQVDILLDLRDYHEAVGERDAFGRFWQAFEPALTGQRLVAGKSHVISAGGESVGLTIIRTPEGGVVASARTRFAVRGILEPPALRYACRLCRQTGRSGYGPFLCRACEARGHEARVCDEHVVILDGSMQSSCREHAPACECGAAATFWCQGPGCRRQRAWCDQHRLQHANDPDHAFCQGCYEALYPDCEQAGCDRVGTLSCEHVDRSTLEACARRVCPSHMTRWQVFGPEKEGLTFCAHHRGLNRFSNEELVSEIILDTAGRKLATRRSPFLPSLQSVRHILRKVRGQFYEIDTVDRLFDMFAIDFRRSPALGRAATDLIAQHATRRRQDRSRDQAERTKGLEYFERLKRALSDMGKFELAQAVTFSDYRPKHNWLFVTIPEVYRGLFVGRGGRTINDLSTIVGASIKLERSGTGAGR